ncbi:MAG TPA: hypothetical protein VIK61_17990 [Acidimicrobiia bacterium]
MRSSSPLRKFASPFALACAALLVLASCHGSSANRSTTSGVPATDAKGAPTVSLALSLGSRQVQPAGLPLRPFDAATANAIRNLVNKYIATGIARPLFTGSPATGLVGFFASSLANRVGVRGRDRAALSDESTPKIIAVTKTVKQPLNLVALEDHGKLVMIGAQFSLSVTGTTDQGPLTVSRVGNLVFEPNSHKTWFISGYSLIVRRDNGGTTTTLKATTTTAAP